MSVVLQMGRPGAAMKAEMACFVRGLEKGARFGLPTTLGAHGHASNGGRAPEAVAWDRANCNASEVAPRTQDSESHDP